MVLVFHLKSSRIVYSLLVVEGGVRFGNLWVSDGDLLWGGEIITSNGNGGVVGHSVDITSVTGWGGVGGVTGGLVWSSGLWVGVVMWDVCWLLFGAWGTGWAILWSVSSGADLSGAVNGIGSVVTVAFWEWLGGLDLDWGKSLLNVVEFITLHGDIFSEVLITVHSGGEELNIRWSTGDTSSAGSGTGGDLDESSSGWGGFSVWWLSEEGWSILEFDGGGGTDEKGNNEFHFCFIIFY